MKKEFVGRFPVWASIYDGYTHIERRVYIDDFGYRHVKINGGFVKCDWIFEHWDLHIYF